MWPKKLAVGFNTYVSLSKNILCISNYIELTTHSPISSTSIFVYTNNLTVANFSSYTVIISPTVSEW